jgi:hypothetical protein
LDSFELGVGRQDSLAASGANIEWDLCRKKMRGKWYLNGVRVLLVEFTSGVPGLQVLPGKIVRIVGSCG